MKIAFEKKDDPSGRYHRQSLLAWWDQELVSSANVLLIGAGALGNEIAKCLALMGIGRLVICDMDSVDESNLSRGVFFRDDDCGRAKAELVAAGVEALNPSVRAIPRVENIVLHTGLGLFDWADVVIAGVDNREARVFVNFACAQVGKPWVDGAIEGLSGVVRVFDPANGPCYECTMNETDRRLLSVRRSCARLARDAESRGFVPTTAVAASIVGALQAGEGLKLLHDQPVLSGAGVHFDGFHGQFDRVGYPKRDDCLGHDRLSGIEPLGAGVADVTLDELLTRAEGLLGAGAVLDLSRDIVTFIGCPECGTRETGGCVVGSIRERDAGCPACGTHRVLETTATVDREQGLDLDLTAAAFGIPPFDVVVPRCGAEGAAAWLFDGDAESVTGAVGSGEAAGAR